MDRIAKAIEEIFPYEEKLLFLSSSERTINDAIGISVAQTALTLPNVKALLLLRKPAELQKECVIRPCVQLSLLPTASKLADVSVIILGVSATYRDVVTDISLLISLLLKLRSLSDINRVTQLSSHPVGDKSMVLRII